MGRLITTLNSFNIKLFIDISNCKVLKNKYQFWDVSTKTISYSDHWLNTNSKNELKELNKYHFLDISTKNILYRNSLLNTNSENGLEELNYYPYASY